MTSLLNNRAVLLLAGALLVWGACVLSWAADAPAVWSPQVLATLDQPHGATGRRI